MNTTKSPLIIDLSKYGGLVYTGRSRGEAVRIENNLNDIDKLSDICIIVKIPANTFTLNSSFFLGLFGPSVRSLGSREAFLSRFQFENPEHISEFIESGIERALQKRHSLIP